jgi:transcriptional regulator with XRE-family HTH domain
MVSTGFRIQERRESLHMSRADLAKQLKTTRLQVWRMERGKTRVPVDKLPRIAAILKTTVGKLVQ